MNTRASAPRSYDRIPLQALDPAARTRLLQLRDNLVDRIAKAHYEGWLGEVDGLTVSLDATRNKLIQLDAIGTRRQPVTIGMPGTHQ